MEKPTARVLMEDRVQKALAGMAEGRMPYVMTESDRLDKVLVEPNSAADVTRDTADQLFVEAPAGKVVVGAKREHLRLARKAVIGSHVNNLLHIAHERRPQHGVAVTVRDIAPDCRRVMAGKRRELSCRTQLLHLRERLFRKSPCQVGSKRVDANPLDRLWHASSSLEAQGPSYQDRV